MPQDINDSIIFILRRIQSEIGRSLCSVHGGDTLTLSQMRVMASLLPHAKDGLTQRELEAMHTVSHATVAGIVKRLEGKGLIKSETDEKDRRFKRVFPTELAEKQHSLIEEKKQLIGREITKGMTHAQKEQLNELLYKAYENALAMNNQQKSVKG